MGFGHDTAGADTAVSEQQQSSSRLRLQTGREEDGPATDKGLDSQRARSLDMGSFKEMYRGSWPM